MISGENTNNYFVSAVAAVEKIGICAGRTEKIDSVEVGNLNRATKGGIVNELKKTADIIKGLEKAGIKSGELSASAREYHNTLERILKRVNDSSQMLKANAKSPEAIFGKFVSKADLESVRDAANRLYIAADNYGIVKNNELKERRIKDKDKLIEAVKRFMAMSSDEQQNMGLAGRKYVEKNFDRSIVVERYMTRIDSIIGK
ncbi:MAG: hypothetical protein II699_04755 [Lachnospiraceae bacterium]|nr:hypothetical protein [Lachnospiraceae bacterium]